MDWLATIQAALVAYNKTVDLGEQLVTYFKKAEAAGWFERNAEIFKPLQQGPTTEEEKKNAAKAIAQQINKL